MRRTKIVCTLGPATARPEQIEALLDAGMNVARLNFSHGNHEWHAERIRTLRGLAKDRDQPLAILQDLAGPKIRIGDIPGHESRAAGRERPCSSPSGPPRGRAPLACWRSTSPCPHCWPV